jgi:hypothetical protein
MKSSNKINYDSTKQEISDYLNVGLTTFGPLQAKNLILSNMLIKNDS